MSENGDQQLKNPEIVDKKTNNTNKESTIEEALKQKLPDSQEKQQLFLDIFQQPTFANLPKETTDNSLSQKDILEYIKNRNLIKNSRILKDKPTMEEKTKFIMEDMDIYFKSTTGAMKIIQVYGLETETNEVKELKNQAKQFLKTKESYTKLPADKQIQVNEENKKTIPSEIIIKAEQKIKKIKENMPDSDIQINDYLSFYLTAQQEEVKDTDFAKDFKDLNTKFGIMPDTSPDKITGGKLKDPENGDNAGQGSDSVRNFTQNSKRFDNISAPKLPESKDFDTDFDLYVKFVPDEKIRENIKNNKDIIKKFAETSGKTDNKEDVKSESPAKEKEAYEEYTKAITDVKENLPNRTQAIIKQRVMGSCITGLAKYFDTTTMNKENFADDFDIDTQKGFKIEKGERQYDEEGDDVLYINGNINGNNVGFYYNLNNPDAQLKSDDFLHFDDKTDSFDFGAGSGGKNELGVKLPTIGMLSAQAQGVSERNFDELLEKSASMEDFEASFKQQVSNELLKNYGQEMLVKTRVERDVEKNIAAQTLHNTFIPEVVATGMNKESINKTTKSKARELMNIRDKSTENMRSDELRRLRSLTQRLDPLITQIGKNKQENLEPKWQKLFENMKKERESVNYDEQRGAQTLTFFKKFSKNDKLNLEDLDAFITGLEKKESVVDNMSKYSPDFQTNEDHDDADGLIKNIA